MALVERLAGSTAYLDANTFIHAVSALQSSCTHFVTNDAGLRVVPGIEIVVLSEVARQP